jgi:hypothetical protein
MVGKQAALAGFTQRTAAAASAATSRNAALPATARICALFAMADLTG